MASKSEHDGTNLVGLRLLLQGFSNSQAAFTERFQHLAAVAVLHLRARNASPETFSLEVSSAQPRIPGTSPPPKVTESLEHAVQSMYDTATMAQQPDQSLETVVRAHTTAWLILNPTGQYPPALPTGPDQRLQHPKE